MSSPCSLPQLCITTFFTMLFIQCCIATKVLVQTAWEMSWISGCPVTQTAADWPSSTRCRSQGCARWPPTPRLTCLPSSSAAFPAKRKTAQCHERCFTPTNWSLFKSVRIKMTLWHMNRDKEKKEAHVNPTDAACPQSKPSNQFCVHVVYV